MKIHLTSEVRVPCLLCGQDKHTKPGRRYQRRDSRRMFCKTGDAEDGSEHFIYCKAIQDLFRSSMKAYQANRGPLSIFSAGTGLTSWTNNCSHIIWNIYCP